MLTKSVLHIAKPCGICSPSSRLPNEQISMKGMARWHFSKLAFPLSHQTLTASYSLAGWVDIEYGATNAFEILPDNSDYTLLNSHLHTFGHSEELDVAPLPVGLQSLVTKGLLSESTRRLLLRFSHAWQHGIRATPISGWQFPDFAVSNTHFTTATPSLERCLVLTIFCYARAKWSTAPRRVAGMLCQTVAKNKLAQSLARTPITDDINDCLIWMWMVLIHSNCLEGSISPSGLSCLADFKYHFPERVSWAEIETDVLSKFFWCDENSDIIRQSWSETGLLGLS
jgi:hypothetical protein